MDNEESKQRICFKQMLWYFIIFSVIGLLIETVFCYVTTGVFESRKGLIWGPFCPVYGVGAMILIFLLHTYEEKPVKLFLIGCVLGNIIEYALSYLLEAYYGTRFWDYSYYNLNLNGRICIVYSVFWGALAFVLIKYVKHPIDCFINKIPNSKRLHSILVTLLILDALATVWAITSYQKRIGTNHQKEEEKNMFQKTKTKIEETLFSDKIMVKTFPNLRYVDEEGNQYYIRDIIKAN